MKRLTFLFLGIFTSLFAEKEDCSCGTVSDDPLFAKAIYLLDASISRSVLDGGDYFPAVAPEFCLPDELQERVDDTYPMEGRISWHSFGGSLWDKDTFLENNKEDRCDFPWQNRIKVPSKAIRKLEWRDRPYRRPRGDYEIEHEYKEVKIFNFEKNYGAIPQAFTALKNDISFYYGKSELFLDARIKDLSNGIDVYEPGEGMFWPCLIKKTDLLERKQQIQSRCRDSLNFTEQKEAESVAACVRSLDFCIKNHQNPIAHINRGLFYYLDGKALNALREVKAALGKTDIEDQNRFQEEVLLLKSQSELEAGLYADAVSTLTRLIGENSTNKEAYFERASAYFELGNFDLCLADYLTSEIKPQLVSTDSIEMISFSLGITKGILQGGSQAGIEFIPSLLSSLQGIAHGLWAFAQDPVEISQAFVQSSQACINFIRENTLPETLTMLVPELRELIENWDQLEDGKKGEITGHIIGKYGVDIFAGVGIAKGMKLYRELKKANNLMTFEAMAISERNRALIKLEAARKGEARREILKHSNLTIQWDKQGKHVHGHKNFEPKNRSILVHPDPDKLFNNFYGKGMRSGNKMPGTSGYQEIVDFGEFIGYAVQRETGEKIATSWGKIHYAKDGVHIVPTKPRG